MRGKAQRVAHLSQTLLQTQGLLDQSSPVFIRRRGVIGGAAIPPIRCGMPVHRIKVEYASFRRLAPNIGHHSNVP